jgi:hypothetical protein
MYLDDIAARIRQQLPSELLPDEAGIDELLRLYALLVQAKGVDVTAEDIHDAWSVWMASRDPGHDAIKPYGDLDAATKQEDAPFLSAVRTVATDLHK